MKKSLLEFIKGLPDKRRGAGQRHQLEFGILIIIMSMMSGYIGIRAIGDFAERNKAALIESLKPKKPRVPSFSTIRRIMLQLNFAELREIFYQWSLQYVEPKEEEYYSIDGKSIRSTVTNIHDEKQNFISMVTVFSQNRKQVLTQQKYQNKKISEIGIVQGLIEELDLQGITLTMDALHCQKKQ
jgi:hypothetical protein